MLETLNPPPEVAIDPAKVHASWRMRHPVMDAKTLRSQASYAAATRDAPRRGRRLSGFTTSNSNSNSKNVSDDDSSEDGGYVFADFGGDGCGVGNKTEAAVAQVPVTSNRSCGVWLAGAYRK